MAATTSPTTTPASTSKTTTTSWKTRIDREASPTSASSTQPMVSDALASSGYFVPYRGAVAQSVECPSKVPVRCNSIDWGGFESRRHGISWWKIV